MQAARYHKTSIDALLHPRHHSATPYRVVLGDVRSLSILHAPVLELCTPLLHSSPIKLTGFPILRAEQQCVYTCLKLKLARLSKWADAEAQWHDCLLR